MDQSVKSVDLQVLLDLPVKSEVILYTGLSALQKKLYKAVLMKDTGKALVSIITA